MTGNANSPYTCKDYREEMILNTLQRRLATETLTDAERKAIRQEIQKIREAMGMD